jgi:hypothetical protein
MESGKLICRKPAGIFLAILAVSAVCIVPLLTAFALPARALSERDFAGFYQLANATVLGDQVRLIFSARIFNLSGSDITSATLTLKGPGAPHGVYSTFYGLNVADRGTVVISQEITILTAEYQRWKTGQIPLLAIQSAAGISKVELRRGPVGEE